MSIVEIENLGTFTYNYKINTNKKFNVISAALFKSNQVSNFLRYTKNLLKYKNMKLVLNKKFIFRLYYDDSVLQDKYIKKIFPFLNKNYQLIHYNCPNFKNEDGKHNGTFGTLMRFLPFHDFPENDVDYCYVTDVDGNVEKKDKYLNLFMKLIDGNKLNLIYTYWVCHKPSHNINQNDFILGQVFLIRQKIPLQFLVHYVNKIVGILFQKFETLQDKIIKKTNKKYHHKFFYGIDEIYMELYLKKYFDEKKN